MTKRLFNWLTNVNQKFGNIIIAGVTIVLVIVTLFYVVLTWESLKTLENQVSIIQKDYIVRSFPEIHINHPEEEIIENVKGLTFSIINKGFQAKGLKLKIIPFDNRGDPVEKKIGLMYLYNNILMYTEDVVVKLGSGQTFWRFISEKDVIPRELLLIYVEYEVPLQEGTYSEYLGFSWNSKLSKWNMLEESLVLNMLEKSKEKGLLDDF
ncbi:hypothetical protein MYX76_06175 [Desulfobacterota bacterium AH_259_B03_O07]|nr:hypothetical protein [Desulfobacterota bacterium AH_259_B03_O07]